MNSEAIRVLLIEDNPRDARLIREVLAPGPCPGTRAEVRSAIFDLECADRLSTGLERLTEGAL